MSSLMRDISYIRAPLLAVEGVCLCAESGWLDRTGEPREIAAASHKASRNLVLINRTLGELKLAVAQSGFIVQWQHRATS